MTAAPPVLVLEEVAKSFSGVRALNDVSLRIERNECCALVGANGAGKSTLINVACGAVQPDSGVLIVGGEETSIRSPHMAIDLGIATVHQHNQLVPNLTAAENLSLGRENTKAAGLLRKPTAESLAALELVGLGDRADDLVEVMTLAERQLLAIARAVSLQPRLLILDEPTAALTPNETRYLVEVIERVRKAGTSLLYVTHRLQELEEVADRIAVMRDGRVVAERPPETPEAELVELIAGKGIVAHDEELVDRRRRRALDRRGSGSAEAILVAREVTDREGAFSDVSFELQPGEVLGVVGLPDAGVVQLVETLAGARRPAKGTIEVAGVRLRGRSPREAARRGIGYLAGDRARRGVIPNASVAETVALSSLSRMTRIGFIPGRRVAAQGERLLAQCQVNAADPSVPVVALSGGNQQKALFARVLATEPRVVVCEDPTAGVDVAGRESIYGLVSELCESGGAVVWTGSDLREIATVCDRALVLWRGTLVADLQREELDERTLMLAQFRRNVTTSQSVTRQDHPRGEYV